MVDPRREFGTSMEKLAAEFLMKQGLQILSRQHKTKFGEIDLICREGNEVVFVEVKARQTSAFGYPEESVTLSKLQHIVRSGQAYMKKLPSNTPWRIDVVAIELLPSVYITHLKAIDIPDSIW